MSQIEGYAKRLSAKHVLFIFDSCFSGMVFLNRSGGGVGGTPPSIENKLLHRVRPFITAGTEEQTVPDDSVFRKISILSG